jgi:hypothetical protein
MKFVDTGCRINKSLQVNIIVLRSVDTEGIDGPGLGTIDTIHICPDAIIADMDLRETIG